MKEKKDILLRLRLNYNAKFPPNPFAYFFFSNSSPYLSLNLSHILIAWEIFEVKSFFSLRVLENCKVAPLTFLLILVAIEYFSRCVYFLRLKLRLVLNLRSLNCFLCSILHSPLLRVVSVKPSSLILNPYFIWQIPWGNLSLECMID